MTTVVGTSCTAAVAMTDSEKRALAVRMCWTWRHDFGLQREPGDPLLWGMTPDEQEALIRRMMQLIDNHWPCGRVVDQGR